jgi:hypothetical protein
MITVVTVHSGQSFVSGRVPVSGSVLVIVTVMLADNLVAATKKVSFKSEFESRQGCFGSATPCASPPPRRSIFPDFSYCVHHRDDMQLLAHAMASDLHVESAKKRQSLRFKITRTLQG